MRHCKHRYQLGVKKEHRQALMASLAGALFLHNRIQTTLAKAKALRPYAEKIVTLAKKAAQTDDKVKKLHYYRLALAKVRQEAPVAVLFNERAKEFLNRNGGYTRIYKLALPRVGDAADMAIIELIAADDKGYTAAPKTMKKSAPKAKAPAKAPAKAKAASDSSEEETTASTDADKTKKTAKKSGPHGLRFILTTYDNGFSFRLIAGNNESIGESQIYTTRAACEHGIESVKNNSTAENIEDQTAENPESLSNPKYQIFTGDDKKLHFRLNARNGEEVLLTDSYETMNGLRNGITIVQTGAKDAPIVERDETSKKA